MTVFRRVLPAVARAQGDHEAPLHKIVVARLDQHPGIWMSPVAKDWKGISIDDGPTVWLSPQELGLLVVLLTEEAS